MKRIFVLLSFCCFSVFGQYQDYEDLAESIRNLMGEVETLRREVSELKAEVSKLKNINVEAQESSAQQNAIPVNNISKMNPEEISAKILELLQKKQTTVARGIAQKFLKENPSNIYSGMMMYYVGESYFIEKKYQRGIVEFVKSYKKNPMGRMVPNLLLHLALSFKYTKQKKHAVVTFEKLLKDFPNASSNIISEAKSALKKCK